jgi:hypothetical protein
MRITQSVKRNRGDARPFDTIEHRTAEVPRINGRTVFPSEHQVIVVVRAPQEVAPFFRTTLCEQNLQGRSVEVERPNAVVSGRLNSIRSVRKQWTQSGQQNATQGTGEVHGVF